MTAAMVLNAFCAGLNTACCLFAVIHGDLRRGWMSGAVAAVNASVVVSLCYV